jgi:hypothetical protein
MRVTAVASKRLSELVVLQRLQHKFAEVCAARRHSALLDSTLIAQEDDTVSRDKWVGS